MKVIELITNAYDWGRIFPSGSGDLDSPNIEKAERYLRSIIRQINIKGDVIFLNSQTSLNMTAGNDTIPLDGYIKIIKAQFILGNVRIDIDLLNVEQFYTNAAVLNTQSIPYCAYPKRRGNGIDLIVYFTPNQDYILEVNGLKALEYISRDDDITSEFEMYEDLVTWELANLLRKSIGHDPDMEIKGNIARIKRDLRSIKPVNASMQLSNIASKCSSESLRKVATSGQEALLGGWMP